MSYNDVVQAIKQSPSKVVLMVLQPFEKNVLSRRGVELTSSTCPVRVINGRKERDYLTDVRNRALIE